MGDSDREIKLEKIRSHRGIVIAAIGAVPALIAAFLAGRTTLSSPPGPIGEPPASIEDASLQQLRVLLADESITVENMTTRLSPYIDARRELEDYRESFYFDLFLLERRVNNALYLPTRDRDAAFNRTVQSVMSQIDLANEGANRPPPDGDDQRTLGVLVFFQRAYNRMANGGADYECAAAGPWPHPYLCPLGILGLRTVGAVRDQFRTERLARG